MATTIDTNDPRIARALEVLVDAGQWLKIRSTRDGAKAYGVPSQRMANCYYLTTCQTCTCEDFKRRQQACKHILAVRLFVASIKAQSTRRPTRAA